MMDSKLPHAIGSAALSAVSAFVGWTEAHLSHIASSIAIIAGLYSICAARQTIKLRKKQRKQIGDLDE